MGMDLHIEGVKPPDEKWKKMFNVFEACRKAEIPIPDEVWEFFNHETPDKAGVVIPQHKLGIGDVLYAYNKEGRQGFEIDITKIDKDIKILRFFASF